jgi:hypothetical protein
VRELAAVRVALARLPRPILTVLTVVSVSRQALQEHPCLEQAVVAVRLTPVPLPGLGVMAAAVIAAYQVPPALKTVLRVQQTQVVAAVVVMDT